jgi:hypothetical protein
VREGTREEHAVLASELTLFYHNVKHTLIYSSFDWDTNLIHHILSGSKVESKLSCGRTKAEVLVTNILVPLSVTEFLEAL